MRTILLGLWGRTHMHVVSKRLLHEPNSALDPMYHVCTSEGKHTHRHSDHLVKNTQFPDYISSSFLSLEFFKQQGVIP